MNGAVRSRDPGPFFSTDSELIHAVPAKIFSKTRRDDSESTAASTCKGADAAGTVHRAGGILVLTTSLGPAANGRQRHASLA